MSGLFYIEWVGDRWATQAVSFKTLDAAQRQFEHARDSKDRTASQIRLYDCSKSNVGTLLATG
jgi:hypothetical protein